MGLRLPEVFLILIVLGFGSVWIFALWRLVSKTGNPGVLSLLFLIPLVNFVLLLYFAFAEWPIEREIKALRQHSDRSPA
jgi:hypothetical protein